MASLTNDAGRQGSAQARKTTVRLGALICFAVCVDCLFAFEPTRQLCCFGNGELISRRRLLVLQSSSADPDEEDDDDFSLDAYRARVKEFEQLSRDDQTRDARSNVETALLGTLSLGGGVVGVAAALVALALGLYLTGLNSPFREEVAPQAEESFYLFQ